MPTPSLASRRLRPLLIGFIAVMTALQIIVAAVAYFDLQRVLDNDQREHAVPGELEVAQDHELHEVPVVQARSRRVETAVQRHGPGVEGLPQGPLVSGLGQQPAPRQPA